MGPPSKKIKPVMKASNESPKSSTKKEESTSPTAEGEIKVVQHNQESMDTPRFTPEIYKDKEDMLVYEGECCGRLLYE